MRIRCRGCGNVLGEVVAGHLCVRYRGREILALAAVAIRCEDCGAVWTPPDRPAARQLAASLWRAADKEMQDEEAGRP